MSAIPQPTSKRNNPPSSSVQYSRLESAPNESEFEGLRNSASIASNSPETAGFQQTDTSIQDGKTAGTEPEDAPAMAKLQPTTASSESDPPLDPNAARNRFQFVGPIQTTLIIVGSFVGALIIAIAQFIFYNYLHLKRPTHDTPLSFGTVQILSTIFYLLARSCLLMGLTTAYIQALWLRLRQKWTTAGMIDQLMLLPWTPGVLVSGALELVREAPMEWGFALFCVLVVPIVVTLPGGALEFGFAEREEARVVTMEVPAVRWTERRNETWGGVTTAAMFDAMRVDPGYWRENRRTLQQIEEEGLTVEQIGGVLLTARPQLVRLASRVLRTGEIQTFSNPTNEPNVSYAISFPGPKLRCKPATPLHLEPLVNPTIEEASPMRELQYELLGFDLLYNLTFQSQYRAPTSLQSMFGTLDGETRFDGLVTPLTRIVCELGLTNHTITVDFNNTESSGPGKVTREDDGSFELVPPSDGLYHYYIPPAPESLDSTSAFVYYWQLDGIPEKLSEHLVKYNETKMKILMNGRARIVGNVANDEREIGNPDGPTFERRFIELQARSVSTAMFSILRGKISSFGSGNWGSSDSINNTIITETPFAHLDPDHPTSLVLTITPALLAQAFDNITASLPSLQPHDWRAPLPVTVTSWADVYLFERTRFLLTYAAIFISSMLFLGVGVYALLRNGVSASRGFLQIVTTTAGSEGLKREAGECSMGGEESFSEELRGVRLKFGRPLRGGVEEEGLVAEEVDGGGRGTSGRMRCEAVLGTEDEVEGFKRRKTVLT